MVLVPWVRRLLDGCAEGTKLVVPIVNMTAVGVKRQDGENHVA